MSQIFHTINIIVVSVRTLDYSLWSHHHTCYSQYFKILGIKFTPPFQLYFTYVFVSYTSCYMAKDSWEIRGIWLLQYCKENNDWVTSYMVSWSALSFFFISFSPFVSQANEMVFFFPSSIQIFKRDERLESFVFVVVKYRIVATHPQLILIS